MDEVIHIIPLKSVLIELVQGVIARWFPKPTLAYQRVSSQEYHSLVLQAQTELNEIQMPRLIISSIEGPLKELLNTKHVYHQSNLYLRAARPRYGIISEEQEVVGWHRESLYGSPPESWNVWIPILNVDTRNSLRYIPGSTDIPNEALTVVDGRPDPNIKQGSDGHRIGLLYAPKEIVGGVDFSTAKTMDVPIDMCAVFPGEMIHGSAANDTDDIRFSLDMRVISAQYVSGGKEFHLSSGQKYFIPLERWDVAID